MTTILAIESSCDETSVSIISNGKELVNLIASQFFHSKYGGVIPELASRAHLLKIQELTNQALQKANLTMNEITAIAVTKEPGLVGALVVGSSFAKGISVQYDIPIIPINHIEGHLYSIFLEEDNKEVFPYIGLVVSGGHTSLFYVESYSSYKLIGNTIDDAAGEAFDKIGKLIGMEYPAGPLIDIAAKEGNNNAFNFPRPLINEKNYNFSFSGLKTSVRYFLQKERPNGLAEEELSDFLASIQEAICEPLVKKSILAAREYNCKVIAVSGGVSANSRLQHLLKDNKKNIDVYFPSTKHSIDNAAMIGFLADKKLKSNDRKLFLDLQFTVSSRFINW